MSEANIQKMQDLYAAFGRGDIGTILNSVSDDVTWGLDTVAKEIPWYGIRRGREAVGDFFATLQREVDFTQFAPKFFAATGNHVLVHVDIGYRLKKNGNSASVGSLHEFEIENGSVKSFRGYEDTASVRDAWNA
jgi:ketosteroid isomerase-like protein